MSAQILVTKLFLPPAGPGTIARPRLMARLDAGLNCPLTLVSAPAGFGKTTLVSRWVTSCGRPVAWLSLEETDSDPTRFLAYLIAALRTVAPGLPDDTAPASSQPPPMEASLTTLLNTVAVLPEPIVLVLDDYHLVDSHDVDDALTFLVDHLPPQLHLVVTTREDPRLPLARLRARRRMIELRAADLRFTTDEAAAFLVEAMGLELTADDVEALGTRTEGWIAGLQLAALSIQGRDDAGAFIQTFAGDARYVVDYLVEEVLRRQPEHVRDFLLQTSILDRLSGPLCDAVTGQSGGASQLEALERGNVFVVPLDDRRRWYRYHHLFADVLRAYLVAEHPDLLPELHRRASAWHRRHGDLPEAIGHALAAADLDTAADLIEMAAPRMRQLRREVTLRAWLDALPDELIQRRPPLGVDYAGVLLSIGETDRVESLLHGAEQRLDAFHVEPSTPNGTAAALRGWIAIYRAGLAQMRGDAAATQRHATHALDLLAEQDDLGHGAAAGLLGLASWTLGDLEAAYRLYTECMARLERAGFIADLLGCMLVLADIRITQGRLHEAMEIYERGLRLNAGRGGSLLRGTADMHVGIAALAIEHDDMDTAITHLQQGRELGEHMGLPQNPYRWCATMARVREAQGDHTGARELLDEAERRYAGDFSPNVRPVPATRARLWIVSGDLGKATAWAREQGVAADDAPTYLLEYAHVTLARLLLARYRRDRDTPSLERVMALLDRLQSTGEESGRTGSVIEILMLRALALEACGDLAGALPSLERALSLAESEGYIRLFIGEGLPMTRLLTEASARGIMPRYTATLLAAVASHPGRDTHPSTPARDMAEPLTEREIEVLRLVAEGRSNREIADRLFLALDTVKGHNRRIFAKLDVERRTEAIARARELGLL